MRHCWRGRKGECNVLLLRPHTHSAEIDVGCAAAVAHKKTKALRCCLLLACSAAADTPVGSDRTCCCSMRLLLCAAATAATSRSIFFQHYGLHAYTSTRHFYPCTGHNNINWKYCKYHQSTKSQNGILKLNIICCGK